MHPPAPPDLPRAVRAVIGRLRRRIRLYVLIEGLAAVVALLGTVFWVGLAIDWLLEPPPFVRAVAIGLVAAASLYVAYRYILSRAFARLSNPSMAVLLERYFESFGDSLVTSVELAGSPDRTLDYDPQLLKQTCDEALANVGQVRLRPVFNLNPLVRKLALAVVAVISIGAFGVFASDAFGFWVQRMMLASDRWPRKTRLTVEGFLPDAGGVRSEKVARHADFPLVVLADAMLETPPPERVEVRFRREDGHRGRAWMTRVGTPIPGRDDSQRYHYLFESLSVPLAFDVIGGDDRVQDLRLNIVDRPQIVQMLLDCHYPAYMRRTPRQLVVTGTMQIPAGTDVTIRARTSKVLRRVVIGETTEASEGASETIDVSGAADRHAFDWNLGQLDADRTLLITLHDQDGIETETPYRLVIQAVPDTPPEVAVQLSGIGTAITTHARIPVSGTIRDDYGVHRAWFEYRVDATDVYTQDFDPGPSGENLWTADHALDARQFGDDQQLQVGQKLFLAVQAEDLYDLGDDPHLGSSQQFVLDVVTPERLRSILESRELLLRRRFETIYGEMIDTRDLLARTRTTPSTLPDASAENDATNGAQSDQLRIVVGTQNVQRFAHETLDVAAAFDGILLELNHNRIATDELSRRLRDGIAEPLESVGSEMLPELAASLKRLKDAIAAPNADSAPLDESLQQADAVLVEMKSILDRMLELESYNEVLALLRKLIEDQEKLNEETKKQQRSRLRDLLE